MTPIAEASLDANRSWRPWFRVMVAQREARVERQRQYLANVHLDRVLSEGLSKGGSGGFASGGIVLG